MNAQNKPKYPKGERVWVSCYNKAHELKFIITSKVSSRDYYYLYELVDGEFRKLGRSKSPKELEEAAEVERKLCDGS